MSRFPFWGEGGPGTAQVRALERATQSRLHPTLSWLEASPQASTTFLVTHRPTCDLAITMLLDKGTGWCLLVRPSRPDDKVRQCAGTACGKYMLGASRWVSRVKMSSWAQSPKMSTVESCRAGQEALASQRLLVSHN